MIRRFPTRTLVTLAALTLASVSAVGAQAPQVPPPPPAGRAAVPVLLPPPPLAPAPSVRRPVRSVASVAPSTLATPVAAPVARALPDSIQRGRARIALASPIPLVAEAPRRRVREFGAIRTDVARQPAPSGATGRCRDGTYLTAPASEEACAGKGGMSIRMPPTPAAPLPPARRP